MTDNLDYQDTYHAGLGVYYRVAEPWLLMAGFGYDTSPTSRPPASAVHCCRWGQRTATRPGFSMTGAKIFSVGLAYTLIDAGTAKVNKTGGPLKGDLEGEYDTNFIHAFNLNFVYRF